MHDLPGQAQGDRPGAGRGHRRLSQMRKLRPGHAAAGLASAGRFARRGAARFARRGAAGCDERRPRALAEAAPRAATDTQTPGDTVRLERKPAPGKSSIQRSAPRAAAAAAPAPPPLPGGSAPAAPVGAAPAGALAAGGKRVAAAATGPASLIVPEPAGEPGLAAHWLAAMRQHYWISLGGALSAALVVAVAWLALRPRSEAPATADAAGAPVAQQSEAAGELAGADATEPDAPARAEEPSDASTDADAVAAATSDGAAPPAEDPAPQTAATEPADSPTPSLEKAGPAEAASADEPPAKSPQTGPLDTIARALATEPEPLTSTDPSAAGSSGGPRPQAARPRRKTSRASSSTASSRPGWWRICRTRFRPWNSATCR